MGLTEGFGFLDDKANHGLTFMLAQSVQCAQREDNDLFTP
jgi:hypothetical protein